mgnify:CR=1 FL=1
MAERKGVELRTRLPDQAVMLPHDPPRMGQVLGNLIGVPGIFALTAALALGGVLVVLFVVLFRWSATFLHVFRDDPRYEDAH